VRRGLICDKMMKIPYSISTTKGFALAVLTATYTHLGTDFSAKLPVDYAH
jgi:hypothetical protein